ncbi:hypothetical protein D3C78_1519710 [compost metagenome]
MTDEIPRIGWRRVFCEIGGRANNRAAPCTTRFHRNHIRIEVLSEPQTGIEAFRDDIFEAIIR